MVRGGCAWPARLVGVVGLGGRGGGWGRAWDWCGCGGGGTGCAPRGGLAGPGGGGRLLARLLERGGGWGGWLWWGWWNTTPHTYPQTPQTTPTHQPPTPPHQTQPPQHHTNPPQTPHHHTPTILGPGPGPHPALLLVSFLSSGGPIPLLAFGLLSSYQLNAKNNYVGAFFCHCLPMSLPCTVFPFFLMVTWWFPLRFCYDDPLVFTELISSAEPRIFFLSRFSNVVSPIFLPVFSPSTTCDFFERPLVPRLLLIFGPPFSVGEAGLRLDLSQLLGRCPRFFDDSSLFPVQTLAATLREFSQFFFFFFLFPLTFTLLRVISY